MSLRHRKATPDRPGFGAVAAGRLFDRVEQKLNSIGEKLFKLRLDRIVDPAQTSHRLAIAGDFQRQASRTMSADDGSLLHALDFGARIFNPLQLIDGRRARIARRQLCVQTAQASPFAQVAL